MYIYSAAKSAKGCVVQAIFVLRQVFGRLVRLERDTRGSILPILAIGSSLFIAVVGLSIDLARGQLARSDLQRAVDSAALGMGAKMAREKLSPDDSDLKALVTETVSANLDNLWGSVVPSVSIAGGDTTPEITVTATADLPTSFIGIVGQKDMTIGVSTKIALAGGSGEFAFVVDTSTSIGGDLWRLKSMMTKFVDIVYGGNATLADTFVSITTFSHRVNIGSARVDWLDTTPSAEWAGCVHERSGPPLKSLDRLPTKFGFPPWQPHIEWDPDLPANHRCTPTPILPLTNVRDDIFEHIDSIGIKLGTCTDMGLAWGLRTLLPSWRGVWGDPYLPADYEDQDKVIILISDGQSNWDCYTQHKNNAEMDAFFLEMCTEVKNRGVEIVTVAVDTGSDHRELLRQCASEDYYYYGVVDWADLPIVGPSIAGALGNVVRRIE